MILSAIHTSFGKFVQNAAVDATQATLWENEGYRHLVTMKDWPWARDFYAAALVAYQGNYALPTNWRKWRFLKMNNQELEEVDLREFNAPTEDWTETEDVARNHFAVDRQDDNILIDPIPDTSSNSTTATNAEAAGTSVVIQVPATAGIQVGHFVYISGLVGAVAVKEIASVSAVVSNVSFTVPRLKRSYDAGATVIPIEKGLFGEFYLIPTDLTASDTPIGPARLHLSIAKYAAYLYYLSLEEVAEATKWLNDFNKDVELEWNDMMETTSYHTL